MNFLKVVPLWAITGAMAHDASKGPRGGLPVLFRQMGSPEKGAVGGHSETSPQVTRSTREWMNGYVESTESLFKELEWELTLEGK